KKKRKELKMAVIVQDSEIQKVDRSVLVLEDLVPTDYGILDLINKSLDVISKPKQKIDQDKCCVQFSNNNIHCYITGEPTEDVCYVYIFNWRKGGGKEKINKTKNKFVGLYKELEKYDSYLNFARFVDENNLEMISSSGYSTYILLDHTSDVMCVSLNQKNPPLFVSGSVDSTTK
ncbi:hypothetical protein RFI_39669, partial [Reticulomyxa filosa]